MSSAQTSFVTSFYVVGGTVRRDALCYVQRDADSKLYKALKQGRFCYVLTSRQMGKSSLMVQTAAHLREEGVTVAMLDLTAIGQNLNPEQWYGGLLIQMGQQLGLEDELSEFRRERMELGPLQRWMQAIRQVVLPRFAGPVVIFIDEIDAVRSLPFSTDEFFAGVREFYNHRTKDPELERLTFCLLGVATPSDLIRDTRTTPFNVGQRIELNDFTEVETVPLVQGLWRGEKEGAELLKRVLYWTGGHPYLTHRLCQAVAEDGSLNGTESVDRLCEAMFFGRRSKERDDNLSFVRERMLRSEVDVAGLLSLYAQAHRGKRVVDDETNPLVSVLQLSGIVRVEGGHLQVRNRIYKRVFDRGWVRANMPDAELRRQRAAYRRGLLRAGALAGLILALVSGWAFTTIKQRDLNRQLLYVAHVNLEQQDWEAANIGRMLESLNAHLPKSGEKDLRGFEWYYLWRLCHGELFTGRHTEEVNSVAFSLDGKKLATGSSDHTAKLWDTATGQDLLTLKGHTEIVKSVAFSPDGKKLATGSGDQTVKLWDTATGHELLTFEVHAHIANSVAFSPDGRKLAVGIGALGSALDPCIVKLWDAATGQELLTLKGHGSAITSVAFSPDGKKLATASWDRLVKVWDAVTGHELLSLQGHTSIVDSVAFSPDGKKLATGSWDYTAKLWNAVTGRELLSIRNDQFVVSVAFSPDGGRLATRGTASTVKLWDAATGHELLTLKGHAGYVTAVVFSPYGKKLATGSWDKTVKLWNAATEAEVLARSK